MVFLNAPQGRVLAVILPSMTFIAHAATFLVLEAVFAGSWGTSWCALYDVVAAIASAIGVMGALKRRPVLISTYTLVHAFTLTIMTFILLMNVMPAAITTMVPRASELKYDDKFADRMCRELDDGFGWDTKWLDDCVSSFRILTTGIVWIGLVMMVAQWWALSSVWSWLGELNGKRPRQIYEDGDLERAKGMNGKEKSSFDYKCKE